MKLLQVLIVLLVQECIAYFYPALFWHKDNCGFQQSKGNDGPQEFFLKVLPNNGMNVVCPNQVTINNWMSDAGISSPTLLENMWLVDKDGYDQCKVNGDPKFNKLVLLCDKPRTINFKPFLFHPRLNPEEPRFAPGQHYYFISTSQGFKDELKTRNVSGPDGSCEKYHMKLHIYVCDPKKEDCIWDIPRCDPPLKLYREMLMIDGKLPAPTFPTVKTPKATKKPKTKPTTPTVHQQKTIKVNVFKTERPSPKQAAQKMCVKKEKSVSIHLVLNFVLGGVALFMAIVIIILSCGLAKKSKEYKPSRPPSTSSVHEPNKNAYIETLRYTDLHHQVTPGHRLPPGSPLSNYLILQHDAHHIPQKTPQSYDGRVFTFPEVPNSELRPTHTELTTTGDTIGGVEAV